MVGGAQGRGVEGLVAVVGGGECEGWARETMKIKNSVLIFVVFVRTEFRLT